MKKQFFMLGFLMLLLNPGFAQNTAPGASGHQAFGPIVANTNQTYMIHLNNGNIIRGKIMAVETGQHILVEMRDGSRFHYPWEEIDNIEMLAFGRRGAIGLGLGIPYGILGINGELAILPRLSLSAGIGTTIFVGLGYNAGLKVYLREPEKRWQPNLSAYYGINGMIINEGYYNEFNQKYPGLTLGIGQMWQLGVQRRSGFDFSLMVLVTSGVYEAAKLLYMETPFPVRLSFGYRYAF